MRLPADRADLAIMNPEGSFARLAAGLAAAATDLAAGRPELSFEEHPAPRRLAPHAAALAAAITSGEDEVGWGRFVLLHDPAGQDGWTGTYRIIGYVRAELEPDIAADRLIGEVGWTWLTEALDARSAGYDAISGTVTTTVTQGFGTKEGEPVITGFELRASWSPLAGTAGGEPDAGAHLAGLCDALCTASGLPPLVPGVAPLRPPRRPRP